MIISHLHKFIFLHSRKTAGTSLTVSLSRFLGPEDLQFSGIVEGSKTGIFPPKRVIREAWLQPNLHGLHHLAGGVGGFWKSTSTRFKKRYRARLGGSGSHPTLTEVRIGFPIESRNYLKFAVTRNPWEKTFSDYRWKKSQAKTSWSFDEFVRKLASPGSRSAGIPSDPANWNSFGDLNGVGVDFMIRYGKLQEDIVLLCSQIGIDFDGWLPNLKPGRSSSQEYLGAYSAESKKIVRDLNLAEIECFGYEFGSCLPSKPLIGRSDLR